MDIVEKSTGERQRVIGIYWVGGETSETYIVGFSPSRRTHTIFREGDGSCEIVDNIISERFTYYGNSDSPDAFRSLINSVIVEAKSVDAERVVAGMWDDLINYEPGAHDRLIELLPELLDVGLEYLYCCRVCGYRLPFYTWGRDNKSPTFELCPCCGVQFGVMDETPLLASQERQRWLSEGMPWFQKDQKPENWQPEEQLAQIPSEFNFKKLPRGGPS